MHKSFLRSASLLGFLAVVFGAFAAHGLARIAGGGTIEIFQKGVQYQFYHVFALLAVGILYKEFPGTSMIWSGRMFLSGIILFSGSLYLLAFAQIQGWSVPTLAYLITPLGGLCFIVGWILLAVAIFERH